MQPTKEQQSIIDFIMESKDSLAVEARAGSAKTTTIKMAMLKMKPIKGQVLAVAFNRHIKDDLEKALPSTVVCKTLNALGHAAWGETVGAKLSVSFSKTRDIVKAEFNAAGWNPFGNESDEYQMVCDLVSKAKQVGLVPVPDITKRNASPAIIGTLETWTDLCDELAIPADKDIIGLASTSLSESISEAYKGNIDFDDQIYMSVCFNGYFRRYEMVVVDEAQDLSKLNMKMLMRLVGKRLIAVGDPKQAIYGFRGAHSNAMDTLMDVYRGNMDKMYLTKCFRCKSAIVQNVQRLVPDIVPWEKNIGGTVQKLQPQDEQPFMFDASLFPPHSAILCRNNAPLLVTALRLIKAGKGCKIMGGDAAKGLLSLVTKLSKKNDAMSAAEVMANLITWQEQETNRLRKIDKEHLVGRICDKAESLEAIIDNSDQEISTALALKNAIQKLFNDTNGLITLSTGHKSKGFEWHTVFHINPYLCPSSWAKKKGGSQLEQDLNLLYVIETRAQDTLIELDLANWIGYEEAE